jgi:3D (Asp-Asp-Asp) domain-containing protein/septal ring factor EnvC (AmiA/AmiB activator)
VREEGRSARRIRLLTLAAALAAAVVPTAGAGPGDSLRAKAAELTQANTILASRSRGAVISLYGLDSQLARARAQVAGLESELAGVRRQRRAVGQRLALARDVVAKADRNLARRLQTLYEQGDTTAIEVVLGATSLDDALSNLETLNSSADADRHVISQATAARRTVVRLGRVLAHRDASLRRLEAAARAAAASLARTRTARVDYLGRLAALRRLNASQIASLQQQAVAVAAQARQAAIQSAGSGVPAPPTAPPPTGSGNTLTVLATGYSLSGTTATGAPVGWGVVAVDPSVIPLGTRMTVPGYGEGVAADTGGGVRGAMIDLWFPSPAEAAAWGRRTITITLH